MRAHFAGLSAFACAVALASGLAHATSEPETDDSTVAVPRAADPHARPSASLLLAQPPREVAFVLDGPTNPAFPMLLGFRDASIERHGPMRLYLNGRWGRWATRPWRTFAWQPLLAPGDDAALEAAALGDVTVLRSAGAPESWEEPGEGPVDLVAPYEDALASVVGSARERGWAPRAWSPTAPLFDSSGPSTAGDGFDVIYKLPPDKPVRDWRCQRRAVTVVRYGGESDAFDLVRCDGSMQPEALERLTILARPPEVPRPDALPDEPDPAAWSARHEWLPNVRVVHPRLVWALQQLADAFPRRAVYVFSGYRPMARVGGGRLDDAGDDPGVGHKSMHADGRALDLMVQGVPNEKVLEACRKLADVGCGYYPNSKFVHVDVRPAKTGKAFWIDASAPGEPSRYVDSWPGVVDAGAMSWVPESARVRP
jgi:hypothetical protein